MTGITHCFAQEIKEVTVEIAWCIVFEILYSGYSDLLRERGRIPYVPA